MRPIFILLACILTSDSVLAERPQQPLKTSSENGTKELLKQQLARNWQPAFRDDCFEDWREAWFLDGIKARVSNNRDGMTINTADGFAVLWTQREFSGDLKIEYDFQRVDAYDRGVNIIYIQAQGKDTPGFDLDLSKWSEKRRLAAMKDYYNNMNTYHISYAAFPNDYIRGRRYMPLLNRGLKGTELAGTMMNTGLFRTGQWYHITVIKRNHDMLFEARGEDGGGTCHLVNQDKPAVKQGRIGLRLMPGRESLFKNFSVSTIDDR